MPNPSPTLAQENHWRANPDLDAYSCVTSQGNGFSLRMASLFLQEGVLSLTVLGADSPASRCSSDHQPRHCPNKVGYALRTRCRSSSSSSCSMLCSFSYSTDGRSSRDPTSANFSAHASQHASDTVVSVSTWWCFSSFFLLPSAFLPLYPLYMHVKAVGRPVGVSGRPTHLISSCDLTLSLLS
jgi:hypothetical protein